LAIAQWKAKKLAEVNEISPKIDSPPPPNLEREEEKQKQREIQRFEVMLWKV
jgi:hypothetical protein